MPSLSSFAKLVYVLKPPYHPSKPGKPEEIILAPNGGYTIPIFSLPVYHTPGEMIKILFGWNI